MILYITRKFPPSIGGMQRFNYKLVTNLEKLTSLYIIKWGGSQVALPFFVIYAFLAGIVVCWLRPIQCIYVSDGLLSPLGLILKWFTRKPVVANIHGRDIAFSLKIYQTIIPRALNKMDKVICVSHGLKKECMQRGVPENLLTVIPNGVDIDDFDQKSGQTAFNKIKARIATSLENKKILITVGRLVPKKGVDSFLLNIFPQVIEKNKNVIYLIAGEGPLKEKIEHTIEENNWQEYVFLLGNVPMDSGELIALYAMADIFVMPNVRVPGDMEGFGIVAIEAGSASLPVLAFDVDGIAEAIKNEQNGYLFQAGDNEAFSRKLNELINNTQLCNESGRKAKQFNQENYSWSKITKKYLNVFNTVSGK